MRLAVFLGLAGLLCLAPTFQKPTPSAVAWEKPLGPGLAYREEIDFNAHRSIYVLRVSLHSQALRVTPVLAGQKTFESKSGTSREPVSKIVAEQDALAGVNGDFFSMTSGPSGDPLGLAVGEGRILSTPSKRVVFGWGPEVSGMSVATFSGVVETSSANIKIDGINRRCPQNDVTLYTPDAGMALSEAPCVRVLLRFGNPVWTPSTVLRGRVVSATTEGASQEIAADEAVLVARGNKMDDLSQLRPGAEVSLTLKTTGFDWAKVDSAIGGGPMLLKNGLVQVDAEREGFGAEFSEQKHPRTAIGRTAEGDLLLVAVDGRQETGDGMTLDELAHLMSRLGCVDAMNLDGGGSTTMNVLGVTVNRPSDGKERPVADGVVVIGPRPSASGERLHLSAPSDLSVGTDQRAQVLSESGTAVADIDVIWGATGSCAIDQGGNLHPLKPGPGTVTAYCHGKLLRANVTVR